MNYKIFVMIRFNINYFYNREIKKAPGINKPIVEWDMDRLNYRFELFKNVCFKSLRKQKNKENFHIILLISDDLPKKIRNKLEKMAIIHNFLHIEIYEGSYDNRYLKKYIDENTKIIATVRLDDDDGLHPNFVSRISKYCIEDNINKFITFPKGVFLRIDNEKLYFKRKFSKFIAVGLTKISSPDDYKTVYGYNHRKINKLGFDIIVDNFDPMYVVINHKYGDAGRINKKDGYLDIETCSEAKNKLKFINYNNIKTLK